MPPRLYKTEAIVLKAQGFGETDRLFTLLTPEFGKIRAIAKGVRRPQSHLGGHIQVLSHCLLLIAKGKNIDIITQSKTINFFLPIRENLDQLSQALYILKLAESFTPEGVESRGLFRLLLKTLEGLCQIKEGGNLVHYFELHLLDLTGYRPELDFCLGCRLPVSGQVYFSGQGGGILCPHCQRQDALAISAQALKAMRFLRQVDINKADRLKLTPPIEKEIATILNYYFQSQGLV